MRAYWASPEGQAQKQRLSKERKGRPRTEAQKQAIYEGQIRAAQRLLGIVPNEEAEPVISDEERALYELERQRDRDEGEPAP